ncbi:Phosphoribulokinase / Uridine kinase family protein [Cognatiyoonia koreensis]|uniref:Phosphoribulokinase / Uridine kinase family protein n=1 Tax=Cognatiyoonia koreensis TaxID=364200 RepID=A0A1I0NHN7_9RHOB|nr:AAA family ATPase [Cognatiyoonia koreensis]SEW00894.1 Phosphoribulokinase / Uridine kinase family protein [Cognatiyoonia koreensis]
MQDISHHINQLADRIYALKATQDRIIIAVAGAPGSGKSTLASELSRRLSDQKTRNVVVPMDGFHLDNRILEDRGLMQRKGAPETFDAGGLVRLVKALASAEDVYAPVFDRPRDLAIAGAVHIPPDCPVIIVEGNYLLFDEDPWTELQQYWDITAFLDVPMPELRARLIQRWLNLNYSRTVATRRAESNDIPNAQRVRDHIITAEFTLTP